MLRIIPRIYWKRIFNIIIIIQCPLYAYIYIHSCMLGFHMDILINSTLRRIYHPHITHTNTHLTESKDGDQTPQLHHCIPSTPNSPLWHIKGHAYIFFSLNFAINTFYNLWSSKNLEPFFSSNPHKLLYMDHPHFSYFLPFISYIIYLPHKFIWFPFWLHLYVFTLNICFYFSQTLASSFIMTF